MSRSGGGCPACNWKGRVVDFCGDARSCERCGGFSTLGRALQGIQSIEDAPPDERAAREALREAYRTRAQKRPRRGVDHAPGIVPLRIVRDITAPDTAPGDAEPLDAGDGNGVWGYAIACPGCGAVNARLLHAQADQLHAPRWTVAEGNPRTGEGLSLAPSIHHEAPPGCGWHGWLVGGVFTPNAQEFP